MDWSNFLDTNLDLLIKNKKDAENFKSLLSNYERVDYLINHGLFYDEVQKYLQKLKTNSDLNEEKNVDLSESYRKKGNEFYSKKDNKNAFKYYTFSLLNAPEEVLLNNKNEIKLNKSLVLAYSNRSAVFYDISMYRNCLNDINSAKLIINKIFFENDYSNHLTKNDINDLYNLIIKLLNRLLNSLLKLESIDDIKCFRKDNLFSILQLEKFNHLSNEREEKIVFLIKSAEDYLNTEKESLSLNESRVGSNKEPNVHINNCVDIKFSKEKGRHCLANRDINTGECLFIEKAYCAILLPDFSLSYCELCFKKIYDDNEDGFCYLNIQSCSKCSSVLYCSEKCKRLSLESQNENETFHKYECNILKKLLHNLGIAHLAYRILCSTSQDLIEKYSMLEKLKNLNIDLMKIDYNKENFEDNYNQVFYLLTHENLTHVDDLFKYTLTSLLLGKHYLDVKKSSSLEELKLASCLILRHLLQTICNAHAITQLMDETSNLQETYDREQVRYATAIYPRVSLLNHSCNPNVISSFKENSSTIVVKASRSIKKFNEIFNCYGPHYLKMSLFERRQSLLDQYRFECDCTSCLNQMKLIKSKESNKNVGLRCYKCKSDRVCNDNSNNKMNIIQLKCLKCNSDLDFGIYVESFDKLNTELQKFDLKNLDKEKNLKYISKLESMLNEYRSFLLIDEKFFVDEKTIIDENFKIFYLDYTKLIDLLSRLNCNLKNYEKSSELVEKNIKLLELIYGYNEEQIIESKKETCIELAHELFKLAEIQCNCLNFEQALINLNKAIYIAENVYSKENQVIKEFYELKENILSVLKK